MSKLRWISKKWRAVFPTGFWMTDVLLQRKLKTLLFCHLGGQWRSLRMARPPQQATEAIHEPQSFYHQMKINCTQAHRKEKDCQKSWTEAQLPLVALLPFWIRYSCSWTSQQECFVHAIGFWKVELKQHSLIFLIWRYRQKQLVMVKFCQLW